MLDKIFVSPQVKRIVIITNKHGIYEMPDELPNDLKLRTLGTFADGGAQCPHKKKNKNLGP